MGRSRGGFTSKIHGLADGRGRSVAFALTPGNVADITMALPLLRAVVPPKRLIADKAYDAQSLRDWLKSRKVTATIPSTATRTGPLQAQPDRLPAAQLHPSACSATSRTGGVSRPAITACPATIWPPSRSFLVSSHGPE